jgi:hypothetical protein
MNKKIEEKTNLEENSFHFYLENNRGYPISDEVGVSFGKKLNCPTCDSEKISIFFKPGFRGINMELWKEIMEKNNFELCNEYNTIIKCNFHPNWICKDCYDCGVILDE